MNFDEAAVLWQAVRATHGRLLEIGRRHGGSTLLIAMASHDRRITSIDIAPAHAPKAEEWFARPALAARLELIVGDSRRPLSDHAFGFALIDGDHAFDGVLADTVAHWSSLRGPGPLLCAFHDARPNPGLRPEAGGAADVAAAAGRHLDEPTLTNHYIGVECVCLELIACGAARPWREAGSMQVMEKLADLPATFSAQAQRRMATWRPAAGV